MGRCSTLCGMWWTLKPKNGSVWPQWSLPALTMLWDKLHNGSFSVKTWALTVSWCISSVSPQSCNVVYVSHWRAWAVWNECLTPTDLLIHLLHSHFPQCLGAPDCVRHVLFCCLLPLSLALISNKDEGVALIDIVANESFSSVSLTSQIPGQCISLHIPLPAGFSLVQPACCTLASLCLCCCCCCCCCCQPANTFSARPSLGHQAPMCVGKSPLERRGGEGGCFWERHPLSP